MENHIFNAGLGYLLGLGLHGYVLLWCVIKKVGRKSGWPVWAINALIALHFIAGLTAMLFVPSIYFKNYEGPDSTIDGILFAVPTLTMLFVSLRIAQHWNGLLEKD